MAFDKYGRYYFDQKNDFNDPNFGKYGPDRAIAALYGDYNPNTDLYYKQYDPNVYDVSNRPIFDPYAPTHQFKGWDSVSKELPYIFMRYNYGPLRKVANPNYSGDGNYVPKLKKSYIQSLLNPDLNETARLVMNKTGGTGNSFGFNMSGGGQGFIQSGSLNSDGSVYHPDKDFYKQLESDQNNMLSLTKKFYNATRRAKENGYPLPKKDLVTKAEKSFKEKYWGGDYAKDEPLKVSNKPVPDKYLSKIDKKPVRNNAVNSMANNTTSSQFKWSA